jgi:DNA-directed RNA polymerase subunit F
MIGKSSSGSSPVTLSESRDVLQKRSEEGDFGYEQQTCLDYCKKFAKLEAKKAKQLVEKLMGYKKMKLETACKIADALPGHRSQLVVICQKERVELSESEIKEVLEIVKSYK